MKVEGQIRGQLRLVIEAALVEHIHLIRPGMIYGLTLQARVVQSVIVRSVQTAQGGKVQRRRGQIF